jgi:hypothetical protein
MKGRGKFSDKMYRRAHQGRGTKGTFLALRTVAFMRRNKKLLFVLSNQMSIKLQDVGLCLVVSPANAVHVDHNGRARFCSLKLWDCGCSTGRI